MIRKQVYITEPQDRALKRQAQARGVSEAELVRQALDVLLRESLGSPPCTAHRGRYSQNVTVEVQ